jgi:hypothetical protein
VEEWDQRTVIHLPAGSLPCPLLYACASPNYEKMLLLIPAHGAQHALGLSFLLSETGPNPFAAYQGARRRVLAVPGGHEHLTPSHSHPILSADPSQLSCFYNSRANISCVWSLEGGLQATACHIHAQSNSR